MVLLVTIGVLLFYALSLAFFLKREAPATRITVFALVLFGLALRTIYPDQYPAGWNEDEAKAIVQAVLALKDGPFYRQGVEGSLFFNSLFQGQLVPLVGANQIAIRTYSAVGGSLAIAAGFALARALGMRVAAAFGVALLLATVPPMVFYGRVCFGGEILFNELLFLAALARVIWNDDERLSIVIAGIALALVMYDYPVGRSLVPLPLLAVAWVPWRRSWRVIAVTAIGLAGWSIFYFHHAAYINTIFQRQGDPVVLGGSLTTIAAKIWITLQALAIPVARDGWMTIQTSGTHPGLVLVLAVVGLILGGARAALIAVAFALGLTPSLLSNGFEPSTHRMLISLPLVCVCAGFAIDRLWSIGDGRRIALAMRSLAVVLVLVAAAQSLQMYFSPSFWPLESRARFDWERTELVESLPPSPHPRFIASPSLGAFFAVRTLVDADFENLDVENWWQARDRSVMHLFDWLGASLQPFYREMLGEDRIRSFGRAFTAQIEADEWRWLRQHGWRYRADCGGPSVTTLVPTLCQRLLLHSSLACEEWMNHTWSGRWLGPSQILRVQFSGSLEIKTRSAYLALSGYEAFAYVPVEQGEELVFELRSLGAAVMQLNERRQGEWQLPRWDQVEPFEPLS